MSVPIEEIWDSIASDEEAIPLTIRTTAGTGPAQARASRSSVCATPWSEVRDRLQKRKK